MCTSGTGLRVARTSWLGSMNGQSSVLSDSHCVLWSIMHCDVSFYAGRFLLSLATCPSCMVIDDKLNVLPLSSATANIEALPPVSSVRQYYSPPTHPPT